MKQGGQGLHIIDSLLNDRLVALLVVMVCQWLSKAACWSSLWWELQMCKESATSAVHCQLMVWCGLTAFDTSSLYWLLLACVTLPFCCFACLPAAAGAALEPVDSYDMTPVQVRCSRLMH
jgi:hypothetical protein